jgi:serine/threonine protein kinase
MNCVRCATPIPDAARFCFACGADVAVSGDAIAAKLQQELGTEFTVERLLGRGGMGLVYLADEPRLGRQVAIKLLPPELTFGRGMVERFLREARTAATLDHPHIVPIYRVSGEGELFWYMMKFVEGESLADVLDREGHLTPVRAAGLIGQVAEALQFAHDRGVVHRDVKPDNVMIGPREWVIVTDFGIAKAIGGGTFTSSGATLGTPYYMSPEQCGGNKTLTGASDQYSLAVMAYQMVSGLLPFTGESAVDLIKQHCFDPPPSLAVVRPGIPTFISVVIEQALAKRPEDRFPTVTAFGESLASAVRGEPSVLTVRLKTTRTTPRIPRWRRVLRTVAIATVTLGVLGVGVRAVTHGPRTAPNLSNVGSVAPVARIQVAPPTATIGIGDRSRLTYVAYDRVGNTVTGPLPVKWLSQNGDVAVVDATGVVTGIAPGSAMVEARLGELSGGSIVQVVSSTRPHSTSTRPRPAAPIGLAYITVGSQPLVRMSINDKQVPNPVVDHEVPAGNVRIRFDGTDSTLALDTTLTVGIGEHLNARRIRLRKRP